MAFIKLWSSMDSERSIRERLHLSIPFPSSKLRLEQKKALTFTARQRREVENGGAPMNVITLTLTRC